MTVEYRTEFLERIERTPTAMSYQFKKPDGFTFVAGQYMLVQKFDMKSTQPLAQKALRLF